MNSSEEKVLRENIRHLIRHVKQKRLNEEQQMRKLVRKLIKYELLQEKAGVSKVDPTPNKNTGINFLEDLLKRIIPSLEDDYKRLTSSPEQRKSYRAHIINAIINTLAPARLNDAADDTTDLQEEIEVDMGDEEAISDEEKFIDIEADSNAEEPTEEETEEEKFAAGVEDEDETGRNVAFQAFKQVEQPIINTYDLLSDPADQEKFYDYLIANVKLYFDKFEGALDIGVEEPTNQAYDDAKSGETGIPEEEPAEEGGLDIGAEEPAPEEAPPAEEEEIFEIEL
tara:strand:- start:201 stop:1049 length:849 start_codon:yes stop_codon:yes gene_type:complete